MLVALHRKHDFLAGESLLQRRRLRRLRLIPLTIVGRSRMDIVSGGITVDDLKRLSSHHSQNMWMVLAAPLIDGHGVFWNVKGPVSQPFLHVDEDVGQLTAVRYHGLGGVCALAGRILAHVHFCPLGSGTS